LGKWPHLPVAKACGDCERRHTKPGAEPPALSEAIVVACELDEERQLGRVFANQNEISPRDWAALRGLHRGKQIADEKAEQQREKEQGAGDAQGRLNQMVGK